MKRSKTPPRDATWIDLVYLTNYQIPRIEVSCRLYDTDGWRVDGSMVSTQYLPDRDSLGSTGFKYLEGPGPFYPRLDFVHGGVEKDRLKTVTKYATRIWNAFDQQLVKPSTFGQTIAFMMSVTGQPVRILRVREWMREEVAARYSGDDHEVLSDPKEAIWRIDQLLKTVVDRHRRLIGAMHETPAS